MKGRIQQSDLQGNILCGYGNAFSAGRLQFLRIDDADAGRRLIEQLAEKVTNAVPWTGEKPQSTINVALTHRGFAALGVDAGLLDSFPADFKRGMAPVAEDLGDTGPSAPERWQAGLRPDEPELLVTLLGRSEVAVAAALAVLETAIAEAGGGVSLALSQPVGLLDHPAEDGFGREHFGFADGLSQPAIADPQAGPTKRPGQGTQKRLRRPAQVAPGEFILGYRDEEGELATLPENPLRRNGSFMVLRKLEQDVAAFNTYLAAYAEAHGVEEELLAAKVIGRWRDGTPLVTSPDCDSSALSAAERFELSNDFRYGKDADGIACPVGAHVRRAHPRDAMGWQGRLTKRHRIIRRGMPYGAGWTDATDPAETDRGLMFICFQASIERQFEVIQARWLNDGDAFGLGDERDLLVANDEAGRITLQGDPPRFLAGLPSFVTTRGGGYFFAPGIGALKALGERKRPSVRN